MTQDAIAAANALISQIQARQLILSKHLNAVRQHMPELSTEEQNQIDQSLRSIHDPVIEDLQNQFSNLSSDYKRS
jgi:hypothetical protein